MEITDVKLMVCSAGTPVLVYPVLTFQGPQLLGKWHPISRTPCEHSEPMPFPSQPTVSKYHELRGKLAAFIQLRDEFEEAVGVFDRLSQIYNEQYDPRVDL